MKNKLYYSLILIYGLVFAFILYINGVFSGGDILNINLLINVAILAVIGVLFIISIMNFNRLGSCSAEMEALTARMQEECKQAGGKNVWHLYKDKKDVFTDSALNQAFNKYRYRMRNYQTKRGYVNGCDIDEFINEDLIDRIGNTHFNAGISGTMTGLGILGTFLGLSMGLGSFNGDDIYTISDNVGPLLSGMKVAFHTSVYGIFFSLVFNFVYRSVMADVYEKLDRFQSAFRQFAMPPVATEDEQQATMVIYQANMANALKQVVDLLKGNANDQTMAVERIVNQFTEQMATSLNVQFKQLGDTIKDAADVQLASVERTDDLIQAAQLLIEADRNMQGALKTSLERQDVFAKELDEQKKELHDTCKELSEDISNQLYTFDQMRSLYEK